MVRSFGLRVLWAVMLFAATSLAQAPASDSQLPDAPQQQPQAQPPETPPPPLPSEEPQKKQDNKPESKIKRTLKRGAPNCVHIGGLEKCKQPATDNDEDDESAGQAQDSRQPKVPQSQPLPRSSSPDESTSKQTQVPLTPPPGEEGSAPAADVQEFHIFNPHKADKNAEIGDFYFKRNNYRAAESRYAEALQYMPNHAAATYKLAVTQEKLGKTSDARANYEKYLKILPSGEFAPLAKKALARLEAQAKDSTSPPAQKHR